MHVSKFHISGSLSRFALFGALAFAMLLAFSVVASAQSADDYRVTYFDNNGVTGAPNAYIHVLNPNVGGALCASIYVWRYDQELSECCSCPISPNGLLVFTVAAATANPGDHPGIPTSGSISIIADSACSAGNPTPTADLRSWATHVNVDPNSPGGFDVTETATEDTTLSSGELTEASSRCSFIRANGSGAGQCDAICTATSGD